MLKTIFSDYGLYYKLNDHTSLTDFHSKIYFVKMLKLIYIIINVTMFGDKSICNLEYSIKPDNTHTMSYSASLQDRCEVYK
jgi:hypothetical protein